MLHSDEKVGSKTVLEILKEKHPATAPLHVESIIMDTPPTPPHPIQFESLTRQVIRRAALNTHGSAGPSGVDADTWRRMCTAFSDVSDQLCEAIAACARQLAAMYVDPTSLEAYVACRLVPLDKQPGVRPIGIGEVLR